MQSPEATCPLSIPQEAYQEMTPHAVLLNDTSQSILDDPEHTKTYLDELEAKLWGRYAEMIAYNPSKAKLAIARKLRAAVRGPLDVLLYGHLLVHFDSNTEDEIIRQAQSSDYMPCDFSDLFTNVIYRGGCNRWTQTMCSLADNAISTAFFDDPKSSFVFKCIDEQSAHIWPKLARAYKEAQSDNPVNWSKRNMLIDAMQSTIENMSVALDVIRAGHLAVTTALGGDTPSEDGVAEILYNSDALGWLASSNRKTFAKILPTATGHRPPMIVGDGSEADLRRLRDVFVFDEKAGKIIPRHPSLRNGEWRWPGNCVGRLGYKIPHTQLAESVQEHFVKVGHPEIFPGDDMKFKSLRALLSVGIEVGRHTILAPKDYSRDRAA